MAMFAASAYGQNMTISGNVIGEDGKPAQGVQIRIDRTDMKGSYKVKTDKKGNYLYAGLPMTGTFTVVVEKDGKDVDKLQGVRTRGGAPAENINFNLQKAATGATAAAEQQERSMSAAEKEAYEKQKKTNEEAMAKNKALND